jgi:hypothetical protein
MDLTQESFDRLLKWLHPNREEAGRIYEKIRSGLIGKFESHGCSLPETLADETINRVAKKSNEVVETYVGDPEPYFRRVGYYILLEYFARRTEQVELPDDLALTQSSVDIEPEFACLEKCVKGLPSSKRELIENYYQGDKKKKIRLRKELALKFNVELPVLRLQARRIRVVLKKCILECLQAQA